MEFPQDMKKCSPEGRDCIENKSSWTFNCSVACEGMYADVQWVEKVEEDMEEEDELGNQFSGTAGKLYKKLKQEIETIKGSISKNGNELDWKKYLKLISEYRQFKRNEIQHFRFDSAAQAKTFGKTGSKTF